MQESLPGCAFLRVIIQVVLARPKGLEPLTGGLETRPLEIANHDHAKAPSKTMYLRAEETAVPELSQLREGLDRAVAEGDWARVAELAALLATRDG